MRAPCCCLLEIEGGVLGSTSPGTTPDQYWGGRLSVAVPAKGAPACSPETWNRRGGQDRQVARAAGWGCPVLGEGLVLVPSTSCRGARWTPTAWRWVVDGVQEAKRSPVGSHGLQSWKSSTWVGVPVVTSGPGLGGPAGLLCLSVSLPLLIRCPRGPLLVPPAHAHPNEPAANLPAGLWGAHLALPPLPAGLPALGHFLPKPCPPGGHAGLPAARRRLRVTGTVMHTARGPRGRRSQPAASRLDPQLVFHAWCARPAGLPLAYLLLRLAGP